MSILEFAESLTRLSEDYHVKRVNHVKIPKEPLKKL